MLIRNLIYILQSESYDFQRFLKFAYRNLAWHSLEQRQQIVWTPKARLLQLVSWLIVLCIFVISIFLFGKIGILSLIAVILLLPIIVSVSLFAVKPVDMILKKRLINQATKIAAQLDMTVIGITGSYGKTSAKEILAKILEKKFVVVKTPENVNTDLGIAGFIIAHKEDLRKAQMFVVEMGAYALGDIAKICRMVSPDYGMLTGINESHLERFGNIQNTIKAKFELLLSAKKFSALNFDDENVRANYDKFEIGSFEGVSLSDAKNLRAKDNFEGIEFEYEGKIFATKLLAKHNATLIMMCCQVARKLGMDLDVISEAVREINPVAHRLEPLYNKNNDITVVDDSYNGNFAGIKSGLEVLSRAKGRKIVLTPGLVELGASSEKVHAQIGELYAKNVDMALLIKSAGADYIVKGLEKNNFRNFHVYESALQAHGDLGNILKNGDTIIFQNDLTDNYF